MQYCPKCKVSVRGSKKCCPLCEGRLEIRKEMPAPADAGVSDSPFPILKKRRISNFSFFRICTFVLVASLLFSWVLDFLTKGDHPSIGLFQLIVLLAWADIAIIGYFRGNAIKLVVNQLYLLIPLVLFLDYRTGGRGWAVSFFIPCDFVAIAILTCVIGKLLRLSFEVYAIYVLLAVLLSQLQCIPILVNWNRIPQAAVISMALMLLIGAALLIFRPRDLKRASHKWFNLS